MEGIEHLGTYVLGTVGIILLPGPNSLYCLSVAVQFGWRAALAVVAAVLLGDSLLIAATVFGAGALLQRHPALFVFLKTGGGLYLAYLGWNLLRAARRTWENRRSSQGGPQPLRPQNHFRRALLLSLSNPKAILFFLSFFTQFVRPDAPRPLESFLILALIGQGMSLSYLLSLSFGGSFIVRRLGSRQWLNALAMAAVGLLFMYFALNLLQASL